MHGLLVCLLCWRSIEHLLVDKGKPGASRGRKATGPTRSAGLPNSKGLPVCSHLPRTGRPAPMGSRNHVLLIPLPEDEAPAFPDAHPSRGLSPGL